MSLEPSFPHGDSVVSLNFFSPPPDGSSPFNHVAPPPAGTPVRNFSDDAVNVPIKDLRGHESEFSLEKDAFAVITNVSESAEKSFTDSESIKQNYYPEIEKMLLEHIPGCTKVVVFEHAIRRPNPNATKAPIQRVHIDQTPSTAEYRIRRHVPKEAQTLLQGRYRIVNVWRPLNGPVQKSPIAVASSASSNEEDLITVHQTYADRTGQTKAVKFHKDQEWYYLSGMKNDERLLLQSVDSAALKGGSVPHTAFNHPDEGAYSLERESIEVKTIVFGP